MLSDGERRVLRWARRNVPSGDELELCSGHRVLGAIYWFDGEDGGSRGDYVSQYDLEAIAAVRRAGGVNSVEAMASVVEQLGVELGLGEGASPFQVADAMRGRRACALGRRRLDPGDEVDMSCPVCGERHVWRVVASSGGRTGAVLRSDCCTVVLRGDGE